ncbi:MAG: hypothetical protein AB7O66_09875 [Limisphaerales bacterium]
MRPVFRSDDATPGSALSALSAPALAWLRSYEKSWIRGDLIAGVTLAAYLVPAGFLALIALVAWIVGAGMIVHFISESVMDGFKSWRRDLRSVRDCG